MLQTLFITLSLAQIVYTSDDEIYQYADNVTDWNRIDFCEKQVDAFYPNYTTDCKTYLRCFNGQTVSVHTCPRENAFSFSKQSCLPSHLVACVHPVCHESFNEFFWLPGSLCRSYYYCQLGSALLYNCPEGKQFSKEVKVCVVNGQCFEPLCTGKPDGNHSDTTHKCQRILHCDRGQVRGVTSCPPNTLFDGRQCLNSNQCEKPEETAVSVEPIRDDCRGYSDGAHVIPGTSCTRYQICEDGKSVARFTCPLGNNFDGRFCSPVNTTSCMDLCSDQPDGLHADVMEGCRKYHYCRGGITVQRHSCPDGSLFTGTMCLPAALVTCQQPASRPPVNPCIGLPDGVHPDYLNNCSSYFYCTGYNAVVSSICPKESVWNGEKCIEHSVVECVGPTLHESCHGKKSGLYQELSSNCESYYFCHNGLRTVLRCPDGHVFDGETCVAKEEYICPSSEQKTCYNQTTGYRTDEESGCRAYYYCSNNHKTTFLCPKDHVFNGTVCVQSDQFSCPFRLNDCNQLSDGYHADYKSKCRNYFLCHQGFKLNTLSCGARKIFNGTNCMRTSNVSASCELT